MSLVLAAGAGVVLGFVACVAGASAVVMAAPVALFIVGGMAPQLGIGAGAVSIVAIAFIAHYLQREHLSAPVLRLMIYALGMAPGAGLGALVARAAPAEVLMLAMGGATLFVGVRMMLRGADDMSEADRLTLAGAVQLLILGALCGVTAGIFAYGGAYLLVSPGFAAPGVVGVASSPIAIGLTSLAAAGAHAWMQAMPWGVAGAMAGGSVLGATMGLKAAEALGDERGLIVRVLSVVIIAYGAYATLRGISSLIQP